MEAEITMLKPAVVDAAGVPLSVSFTVQVDVPATVGVPEIGPLAVFKVRPLGKLPWVIDQVYAGNSPLAANVAL